MLRLPTLLVPIFLFLGGCQQQVKSNLVYDMGERIENGPFTYVVVESAWRSDLGEGFQIRSPKNRFLLLTISVTNGGGADISVPMLSLEGPNGEKYQELSDGASVPNWLGVLRTVRPAETLQGRIVFDVPLSTFRLGLPDTGESGYEKFAWVNIPMSLGDSTVQTPLPGSIQQ